MRGKALVVLALAALLTPLAALPAQSTTYCFGVPTTMSAVPGGTTYGTAGDDVILGTAGNETIYGNGGRDRLCGGGGDDRLYGGAGRDRLAGDEGNDLIIGGAGTTRCSTAAPATTPSGLQGSATRPTGGPGTTPSSPPSPFRRVCGATPATTTSPPTIATTSMPASGPRPLHHSPYGRAGHGLRDGASWPAAPVRAVTCLPGGDRCPRSPATCRHGRLRRQRVGRRPLRVEGRHRVDRPHRDRRRFRGADRAAHQPVQPGPGHRRLRHQRRRRRRGLPAGGRRRFSDGGRALHPVGGRRVRHQGFSCALLPVEDGGDRHLRHRRGPVLTQNGLQCRGNHTCGSTTRTPPTGPPTRSTATTTTTCPASASPTPWCSRRAAASPASCWCPRPTTPSSTSAGQLHLRHAEPLPMTLPSRRGARRPFRVR